MKLIDTKKDSEIAVNILADAFASASNITWFLTPNTTNLCKFFSLLVDESIAKKGAYLSSNKRGVILLYNMKARLSFFSFLSRKLRLILFTIGLKKGMQLLRLQQIQRKHRPKEGMYGLALAMQNDDQKWHTIFELKKAFQNILETSKMPVYAETTTPRYVQMYKSLGFVVYHQIPHPYTDLTISFLKLENHKSK